MNLTLRAVLVALVALACSGNWNIASAQPAPNDNSVLILGSTVSGGAASREGTYAAAAGYTVIVDDAAAWGARTTADFATFRAIILGDATCVGSGGITTPYLDAAIANRAVWGPAITGNVITVGTDPVYHQSQGGDAVTEGAVKFAADEVGATGAYIGLSCYYHATAALTPVTILEPFGSFTATGVGCYNDAHIVAVHPALAGVTDASASNWSCSVHEAFDSFPADFLPLAIARDIGCPSPPGTGKNFADGSCGTPYILARGKTLSPIACGNGILEEGEQCDDSNTANGDGCSAQCTIEEVVAVCGDGVVNQSGEQCDDGNTTNGDGCSATCTTEVISCTLTQGYWKNHPEAWSVTSLTLGTVSYTQAELLRILTTSAKGNGLQPLAYQLIAAKLNAAAGTTVPASVAAAITAADALIGALIVPPIGSGYLKPADASALTATLDAYNNGLTPGGPGHCAP